MKHFDISNQIQLENMIAVSHFRLMSLDHQIQEKYNYFFQKINQFENILETIR